MTTGLPPLDASVLPIGVRARTIAGINGLNMHMLEAGHGGRPRPLLLLLHGFPELAYSWRKLMVPLSAAGFHVVAPDQRGYGRTTGWEPLPGEAVSFSVLDWVRDIVALVFALGHRKAALVGHDFGSQIAACGALIRPDLFRSVTLMSSPFSGPPSLPFGGVETTPATVATPVPDIHQALAELPVPRKHYQNYFSTPEAGADMLQARQGVHDFLRAYYHVKSADWKENQPYPLQAWSAEELAKLPTYYVMRRDETMAETVAPYMPTPAEVASCHWLTEAELGVYSSEYQRTGFRGALQFYHCRTGGSYARDLATFSGRSIDVPSCFISGRQDWGPYQKAGDLDRMQREACTKMVSLHWIENAGHWVQQEQPEPTARRLLEFLAIS